MVSAILESASVPTDEEVRKQLLSMGSLFDGEFTIDWLVALSGLKAIRILSILQEVVDRKILVSDRPGIYSFRDLPYRDKLRQNLSLESKTALHRRIADLLMRDLSEDDKKVVMVSKHLLNFNNDLNGCRTLVLAGDIHRHSFNNEIAFQCYSKVLEDLSGLDGAEPDHLFAETAVKYSKVSTARRQTTHVLDVLHNALAKTQSQGNMRLQSLIEMNIAKNQWLMGQYGKAINHFDRGLAISKKLADQHFLDSITPFGTFFFYWQGKFKEAVANYEKSLPDIEKYPDRPFPIMGSITVGYCYTQIGQMTQGLGMLDSIRVFCLKKGDKYLASMAIANLADVMLATRRIDEAQHYLNDSLKLAQEARNQWVWIGSQLMTAFAWHCKGETRRALFHLNEYLKNSREMEVVPPHTYVLEICQAMESGNFPKLDGLSLVREVEKFLQSQNVFLKGLAYRYYASIRMRQKAPVDAVISSYNQSIKWLSMSGHIIEVARSRLELARYYLSQDKNAKAKQLTSEACRVLSIINDDLVPNDLRGLLPHTTERKEIILKKMIELGKQLVHITDTRDMLKRIISAINQLTGAERGAIFVLEHDVSKSTKVSLRASKNIDISEVAHPDFNASLEFIEETIRTGQNMIRGTETNSDQSFLTEGTIRSMISIPIILRDQVMGVFYHDNRLLSNVFKKQDIEILSFFSLLAAIVLDNAKVSENIKQLNKKLQEENKYYEEKFIDYHRFKNIVGSSPAMQKVLLKISQVAGSETTVLITGETGVGKELVAHAIHRLSLRKDNPFITVQLSSLSENLMPSELFGHEKGAFTGAIQRRAGRFEIANGGTLFLDEIGEIPEEIQIRLLRVLQTRQFERVGGTQKFTSDFRLITATNRELPEEVKAGRFRADLYYRLNVFPIYVPPLRERKEDIPLLAHHFLKIHSKILGKKIESIPKQEMKRLMQYHWPGNVRELENVIERGAILSRGPLFIISEDELLESTEAESDDSGTLAEITRKHILNTLRKTNWKIAGQEGAASLLGIPPSTLSFRMNKLGIKRPGK